MEIIISIIKWVFVESIYGIAIVAVIAYFLAFGLKKVITNAPKPEIIAGIVFFIALFTIPSIPRYIFESETLSKVDGKPWIKILDKTKWGAITEPLTWFNTPVGSIFIVMPNDMSIGGFREVLMQYKKELKVVMTEPDCSDKTIFFSVPNNKGIFQYTSNESQQMTVQEIKRYCEYDWAQEKQALAKEILKQLNE
ncbi:MAG: hypothetical protein COB67_13980 [SAR324 cluster bacterium]|uniref:Uncharacterized protein n=1 Tax=SAR324 cluster bacterium TaxID=2024889 RepID=A0A2A4SK47_9DELT|nr:MAG: hypothetical protein COB67_13980 [SAR324 cluster bacterium]